MDERTCMEPGCAAVLEKKPGPGRWPKWCALHRHSARKVSPERLRESRSRSASAAAAARWSASRRATCLHCDGGLGSPSPTGPLSSYCSKSCKSAASYLRRKAAGTIARPSPKGLTSHICATCKAPFQGRMNALTCSSVCANRRRDLLNPPCSEPGCERGVRAKGLCNAHWRRQARAEGREATPAWDDRRRENYQRRRALKIGASAERIVNADVFDRDGWVCGICADPVDASVAWPDRASASLDHIIPLSRGGAHTFANVQLAHLGCNVEKGARVPA